MAESTDFKINNTIDAECYNQIEPCFSVHDIINILEKNALEDHKQESPVEIRLYNHDTDEFMYKRLTKYEWKIIENLFVQEEWG